MSHFSLAKERIATVLAVDDDPNNRALLRASLEATYRVIEAESGASALAALRADPSIDVVLLDVMMPGLDGYETCRLIKAEPEFVWTPVILLTALHGQEDRNEGLSAGADEFLSKPVERRELLLRVKVFIRLRQQDREINDQLRQLREIDRLKDDLVSLVVHDLRNPLAAMQGFLGAMSEDATDPALRSDIEEVTAAAARIGEIIDDLLNARQLEEGKLSLHCEATDAATLFADLAHSFGRHASERSVTLAITADPEGALFDVDRRLLLRALENLVSNAQRFSARGGVVEVEAKVGEDAVVIEVRDRGAGVDDHVKETLFSKFGEVERRGTGRHGHGLGLYLVRLVANAHGGSVTLESREGGGAVFRIVLPRRKKAPG